MVLPFKMRRAEARHSSIRKTTPVGYATAVAAPRPLEL